MTLAEIIENYLIKNLMKILNYKLKIAKGGFTLLELLIVIAIIGILVAMGTASYSTAQKRARDSKRQGDLKAIQNAFEQYYSKNNGNYPSSCSVDTAYLPGDIPKDPKTQTSYTGSCTTSSYCICAKLETSGEGNSAANCDFAGSPKDYFCVNNLQ